MVTQHSEATPINDGAREGGDAGAPGRYPEAAVDGSPATVWSPSGERSSLTVGWERTVRVATVRTAWRKPSASYAVEVSADGRSSPNSTSAAGDQPVPRDNSGR
jgi:hypothetical protein